MTKEERRKALVNNKIFRRGQSFGLTFCITSFAWVMAEELHMDTETTQKILDSLTEFCEGFEKKRLSLQDMQEALRDEHNITVRFGQRGGAE